MRRVNEMTARDILRAVYQIRRGGGFFDSPAMPWWMLAYLRAPALTAALMESFPWRRSPYGDIAFHIDHLTDLLNALDCDLACISSTRNDRSELDPTLELNKSQLDRGRIFYDKTPNLNVNATDAEEEQLKREKRRAFRLENGRHVWREIPHTGS